MQIDDNQHQLSLSESCSVQGYLKKQTKSHLKKNIGTVTGVWVT